MAVGKFWRKSEDPPSDEKDLPADRARRQSHDLESSQDRKMSRLGEPVAGVSGSDDDLATSIGKQMELEANNSIKYRTCSWQKVNFNSPCYKELVPCLSSMVLFQLSRWGLSTIFAADLGNELDRRTPV